MIYNIHFSHLKMNSTIFQEVFISRLLSTNDLKPSMHQGTDSVYDFEVPAQDLYSRHAPKLTKFPRLTSKSKSNSSNAYIIHKIKLNIKTQSKCTFNKSQLNANPSLCNIIIIIIFNMEQPTIGLEERPFQRCKVFLRAYEQWSIYKFTFIITYIGWAKVWSLFWNMTWFESRIISSCGY